MWLAYPQIDLVFWRRQVFYILRNATPGCALSWGRQDILDAVDFIERACEDRMPWMCFGAQPASFHTYDMTPVDHLMECPSDGQFTLTTPYLQANTQWQTTVTRSGSQVQLSWVMRRSAMCVVEGDVSMAWDDFVVALVDACARRDHILRVIEVIATQGEPRDEHVQCAWMQHPQLEVRRTLVASQRLYDHALEQVRFEDHCSILNHVIADERWTPSQLLRLCVLADDVSALVNTIALGSDVIRLIMSRRNQYKSDPAYEMLQRQDLPEDVFKALMWDDSAELALTARIKWSKRVIEQDDVSGSRTFGELRELVVGRPSASAWRHLMEIAPLAANRYPDQFTQQWFPYLTKHLNGAGWRFGGVYRNVFGAVWSDFYRNHETTPIWLLFEGFLHPQVLSTEHLNALAQSPYIAHYKALILNCQQNMSPSLITRWCTRALPLEQLEISQPRLNQADMVQWVGGPWEHVKQSRWHAHEHFEWSGLMQWLRLAPMKALEQLSISGGVVDGKQIALSRSSMLRHAKTGRRLHLRRLELGIVCDAEVFGVLSDGVLIEQCLELDLSQVGFDEHMLDRLLHSPWAKQLTSLRIAQVDLTAQCIERIARADWPNLKSLYLENFSMFNDATWDEALRCFQDGTRWLGVSVWVNHKRVPKAPGPPLLM